jgi:prenylcysteine oxidase/farnesylcysteine lyase
MSLTDYKSDDFIKNILGLVSLMAAGSTLWHVKGGNYLVPKQILERLLKQSDVQFVNGHVKSVEEVHRIDIDDQGGNVRLSYQPINSELVHAVDYDYVILAFPLHRDNINDFVLQSTDKFNQYDYRMQSTHSNFLVGKLNCQIYNLTANECEKLSAIFYTNPSLSYRCVAEQQTVDQVDKKSKKTDKSVYKIFSPEKLSSSDFNQVFDKNNFQLIQDIPWLAYPKYDHPQKLPPIQVNKNIFYVNAMEWSSSCMEIEAISARNIAMLLTKKLGVELKRSDKHVEF